MKLNFTCTALLIMTLSIVSCSKEDDTLTRVGDPNSPAANQVNQNTNSGTNTNPGGTNTAPGNTGGKPTTGAGGGGNTTPTTPTNVNPHGTNPAYSTCGSCHSRVFKNDEWTVVKDDETSGEARKASKLAREIGLDEVK